MLTDLVIARSALGNHGPDLSRHAEIQCSYGRFRRILANLGQWLLDRNADARFQ